MTDRLFCTKCNRTFRNSEALSMHTASKHTGNPSSGSFSFKPSRKTVVRILFLIGVGLILYGLVGILTRG